jgi:hypothetical protein
MTDEAPEWFHDLIAQCALAALCPPLPIPFFEDWGRNYLRKRIVRKMLAEFHISADSRKIKIMAGEVDEGCLQGCFWMGFRLLTFPWKMIRSVLYIASAQKRMKELSDLIVRFYLVRRLLEKEKLIAALEQQNSSETKRILELLERIQLETRTGFSEAVLRLSVSEGGAWVRDTSKEIGSLMLRMWKRSRKKEDPPDLQVEAEAEEKKVRRYLPASFVQGIWSEMERLDPLWGKLQAGLVL